MQALEVAIEFILNRGRCWPVSPTLRRKPWAVLKDVGCIHLFFTTCTHSGVSNPECLVHVVGQSVVISPQPKNYHLLSSSQLMIVVRGVVFRMLEEPSFLGVSFDDACHFIKRHLTLDLLLFCTVFCQLVCGLISSDTAVGWYPLEHGVVHSGTESLERGSESICLFVSRVL